MFGGLLERKYDVPYLVVSHADTACCVLHAPNISGSYLNKSDDNCRILLCAECLKRYLTLVNIATLTLNW